METMFVIILFVIAFLYASIGHGGASGYLALMALFGIDIIFTRSSALILNLFVAGISFYSYYKAGYFKWRILFPFILGSIPMAYLGGMVHVNTTFYKMSLGVCLIIAVGRMLFNLTKYDNQNIKDPVFAVAIIVGAIVGFFSGMIGIGGGIILSPLLILLKWADIKQSAAISAAFIWLNSFSGLIGSVNSGITFSPDIVIWVVIGLAGGLLGSYAGSRKFSLDGLKYVLATVLAMASIKLFFI